MSLLKESADLTVVSTEILNTRVGTNDIVSVRDFGATGNGVTDDSPAIQSAIDYMVNNNIGGELFLPAGTYKLVTGLMLDITPLPSGGVPRNTISIRGEGQYSTILSAATDGITMLTFRRDGPPANAFGWNTFSDFSFYGGDTPTLRTATGFAVFNMVYFAAYNLLFDILDVCLTLEWALGITFTNMFFNNSNTGVISRNSPGGASSNANVFNGCLWRLCYTLGFDGRDNLSQGLFNGCVMEGCGTHGNLNTGAASFDLELTGGDVGPTFIACYFEGNAGGFDILLNVTNLTRRCAVTLQANNFTRLNVASYTVNNVKVTANSPLNLILVGNTFSRLGGYIDNVARPYLDVSDDTQITDVGNYYQSSVAATERMDQTMVYSGSVVANGSSSSLPRGWTLNGGHATGVYVITHNLGHTNYAVTANATGTTDRVINPVIKATTTFTVNIRNSVLALNDSDFDFMLTAYIPV
ncbi:MAG: glycoside hydrolase family 55 protein [Gammaproteobacteria bacterium]|nr:glycoside hydrolase family 55 protein [Gammaproteobacteria bacterium]